MDTLHSAEETIYSLVVSAGLRELLFTVNEMRHLAMIQALPGT
jgi:hypothetical protein